MKQAEEEQRQREAHELYRHLAYGMKHPPLNKKDVKSFLGRLAVSPEHVIGYRRAAHRWLAVALISFAIIISGLYLDAQGSTAMVQQRAEGTSTYATDELAGYGFSVANLQLVKSVAVLVPAFFFLRFAIRSYRVNKHLEVVYSHRWALQSSLPEYLAHAKNDDERHALLADILPFFYNDIETGHVEAKNGTFRDRMADRMLNTVRPGETR